MLRQFYKPKMYFSLSRVKGLIDNLILMYVNPLKQQAINQQCVRLCVPNSSKMNAFCELQFRGKISLGMLMVLHKKIVRQKIKERLPHRYQRQSFLSPHSSNNPFKNKLVASPLQKCSVYRQYYQPSHLSRDSLYDVLITKLKKGCS